MRDVNRANAADANGARGPDAPSPVEATSVETASDPGPLREALTRLAAADFASFVELSKRDPGLPFEPDALAALNRLAKDRPADFERLRSRLKADSHVRVTALEAAMKANAPGTGSDGSNRSGQPIEYDEIVPWDEPVDGAKLLAELADAIGAYVIMDAHQRDAVALWVVFSHAHDFFVFAPLLLILSVTKRCGKTRLEEVLAKLVPRPETMSGVTAAALARLVEEHRPTILIDEFDAASKGNAEMAESLRGQLNSSFNRSGAHVLKGVPVPGGGWEMRKFSTWAPTCVAGIGHVPDTVSDRSVIIRLARKLGTQTVKRLRARDGGELRVLARKIARFVADNEQRLRRDQPDVPNELNDRARDAWEPLLAIADLAAAEPSLAIADLAAAGRTWPERGRRAATTLGWHRRGRGCRRRRQADAHFRHSRHFRARIPKGASGSRGQVWPEARDEATPRRTSPA